MKKFSFLLFVLIVGCDSNDILFENINSSPQISLFNDSFSSVNEINDTIKVSQGNSNFFYPCYVLVKDENLNLEIVRIRSNNPNRVIIQSDSILIDNQIYDISKSYDSLKIEFATTETGMFNFELEVIDEFDKSHLAQINLLSVENKNPIIEYDYEVNDLVVNVDLSKSYDLDSEFGGQVVLYSYKIGNKTYSSLLPTFKYSFPDKGNYNLTLWVTDNDLSESEKVIINLNI